MFIVLQYQQNIAVLQKLNMAAWLNMRENTAITYSTSKQIPIDFPIKVKLMLTYLHKLLSDVLLGLVIGVDK